MSTQGSKPSGASPKSGEGKGKLTLFAILSGCVTLLGLIVAADGFEESRLDTARNEAESSYYQLVSNLGSENVVVRVGAIGQIESVLTKEVPIEGHPRLGEGLLYVLGLHEHKTTKLYHESMLRVISALVLAPKGDSEASRFETDSLLKMLCTLGPEGWYNAELRKDVPDRGECLAWIWENAPEGRATELPSYPLFRSSYLHSADFGRYDLRRADFSGSLLDKSSFTESDLRGGQFRGADMRDTSFVNADLRGASFVGARIEEAQFAGADLAGA